MRHFFLALLFCAPALIVSAQLGCTDPQALNFDPVAVENDGSCAYGLTELSLIEVTDLPLELKECSGVEWLDSGLWVHNDGGNEDKTFRIDSLNGSVQQSVIIATADNIDWEDITEDENHIYIGDFGNNPGNRTDLGVYRIKKTDLINNVVNAELITFSYSDQTDFTENINNNDFDCEAFIYHNDSLHFFTKNWIDNQTKHYVIPAEIGDHTAQLIESFDVGGLITGADISANGEIILVGYTEIGVTFMWLIFDYSNNMFFSGNKRRISAGTAINNGQTEGITFRSDGYGYICSEEFKIGNQIIATQKLLSFSIKPWIDNTTSVFFLDDTYVINSFPNPFVGLINIKLSKPIDLWRLYNIKGQVIRSGIGGDETLDFIIDTENLASANYFLEIRKSGKHKIIQLMKK